MTPLPRELGGAGVVGWRLDQAVHAPTWDSGEGAFRQGGRWNSRGVRSVYCSLDPSTAILEVAVHKTFRVLDTVPHVLTSFSIADPSTIHVVQPGDVPNPNWLTPGIPGAGQQQFGDDLLARHTIFIIPSAVSTNSWNLVFESTRAAGGYSLIAQSSFALDTRLHPPTP
jgi:RES domain-containing protein